MWEVIKKRATEHIATTIVAGAVSLLALVAVAAWGAVKASIIEPSYSIRPAQLLKTEILQAGETHTADAKPIGVRLTEGTCLLSAVSGRFDALAERVGVYAKDGEWVYDFKHGAARIEARIDCYSHPVLVPR